MDDDLGYPEIVAAMGEYTKAKQEHDAAYDEYVKENGGWSWGYHGAEYIENVEKATKNFRDAMQQVIAREIRRVLDTGKGGA